MGPTWVDFACIYYNNIYIYIFEAKCLQSYIIVSYIQAYILFIIEQYFKTVSRTAGLSHTF
jgi:hypothetical protein